ncbi:MAG TPA: type 4a pilus biogenesis protein PilO [Kofleriaceae bacterium]|jgi:Tfp pilus assembly protein PilO
MATTGPMADFARLPTRQKVLLFVVIGAMGALIYYQFGWKGLKTKIASAEARHSAAIVQSKKNNDDKDKYDKLKVRNEDLGHEILKNQAALPTEAELPAFFDKLERKVRESGVEIGKWQKKPEVAVEQFMKVSVEIEITGTFMQIKRFFASLQSPEVVEVKDRIVSIENLALTQPVVRDHEIYLTAHFVAVTYRQEEKLPEAPGGSGAAAPAAPTAPAVPTPAPATPAAPATPPPMPSAATPMGAKARVEDSMQKVEQRNDAARLKGGL